jgi:adenosylcobinamide-GDP ribazoletransferase
MGRAFLSGPRAALSFLTVLPVGGHDAAPSVSLGRAWFPAVGLLLGGIAGGALWLVSLAASPLVGAVAALAVLAFLTGALHLDGLADAADGLLGGATPERRLEIMRDSRLGSFGAVAVVLVLLGDWAALAGMPPLRALIALLAGAAMARLAVVCVLVGLPYVRPQGLGVAAQGARPLGDLAVAGLTAALPIAFDWRHGILAAALVALATLGVAALARARVGGATGDVYGAVVEVGQLAALIGFAVRL